MDSASHNIKEITIKLNMNTGPTKRGKRKKIEKKPMRQNLKRGGGEDDFKRKEREKFQRPTNWSYTWLQYVAHSSIE